MLAYLTPQLPLEGAILAAGGFEGLPVLEPEELIYLRLSGGAKGGEEKRFEGVMAADLIQKAVVQLAARIAWFDDPATPYYSRVAPHSAKSVGDYDHLARVREWSPGQVWTRGDMQAHPSTRAGFRSRHVGLGGGECRRGENLYLPPTARHAAAARRHAPARSAFCA